MERTMIPRFRAWDKEYKEMVQVYALVFDEQIIKATYKNGNVVKEDIKNYVLMQSTGLRDKNGKEIFEGDILKVTNLSSWLEVVSFNKDAAIIAGVDPRGQRMLTTVFITSYQYEFTTDAIFGVTLEGYLTDREVIKR